jgi:MscS family membrane protein
VDDFNRGVPRTSVEGYLDALRDNDYERAAEYLDLRNLQGGLTVDNGPLVARKLGVVLGRTLWIDLEQLSEDPRGHTEDGLPASRDRVDSIEIDGRKVDILLQRVPRGDEVPIWKFSDATLRQVPDLYDRYGYSPVAEKLMQVLPEGKFLGFYLWQWVLLLLFITGAWLAAFILSGLLRLVLRLKGRTLGEHVAGFIKGPLFFLIFLFLLNNGVHALDPPKAIRVALQGKAFFILVMSWFLFRFVDLLRDYWKMELSKHGREQTAVVLNPLATTGKVVIIIVAVVLWLDNIGFDVTTLVTGLGLGGIGFALAAQKSMEDIFGAVTLFSAVPVRVGDFCRFGDQVGTVEEIGLRVTVVRTLDRTVVSVPNAMLATMPLENYSVREKFRYAPRLRLRYGTSPDQVRRITAAVKDVFHSHPKVIPPPSKVCFTEFGDQSMELDVFTYVDAADFDKFQEIAEELNLRIIDIVREAGAEIAGRGRKPDVDRQKGGNDPSLPGNANE